MKCIGIFIFGLSSSLGFPGAPQVSGEAQLVAVVIHGPKSPGTAEIWPLGQWRNGRMEDISHSWSDRERGSWKKLSLDAFPLKNLMPFTMYANGKKAGIICPTRIFDWDCGLESGLTLAQAPWSDETKGHNGEVQDWVALSHATPDLGTVQPLSKRDATLLGENTPGLAIRAMRQKWPDQAIGKLMRLRQVLFPLDRSGTRGVFAHLEFKRPDNDSPLVVSLVLDAAHPEDPKILYAEMGESSGEAEVVDSRLIGAFDLDGSGSAALLEESSYYEDTGYAILKREGSRYIEIYRGSTYGE